MSYLSGETIVCGQSSGSDVQLRIFGDEFYARYEAPDGYTVVYDLNYGCYCYALLAGGRFVSSGVPIGKPVPDGLRKHLKEAPAVRNQKFERSYNLIRPPEFNQDSSATFTFGPDEGLLEGRKFHQGTVRGLTIIVDFDDVQTSIPADDVEEMFNGANYSGNGNFCSVNRYFQIVSSGKLNYVNTVVGPVKLSKRRSHYISNLLVKEALDLAVSDFGIDLSDFDSRDEGIVDAINFLYAGQSQYNGNLWPHNSVRQLQYNGVRTHYYQLTGLGSRPVDLRIGTICHENGHLLCRFPDMYDYGQRDGDSEKSQGIGRYCLMGSGNHLNGRRTPAPICAYLRDLAGWVDDITVLNHSSGRITAQHGSYHQALKFETDLPNEYFMVENRSQIGLDSHLPANGLAIYHCDTLGSNEWQDGTRNRHYQCALLQADGSLDLENNRNAGDSTDLFSNVTGVALSDLTMPSSRTWNGTDSGLVLSEIGSPGQSMSFTVGSPVIHPVVNVDTSPNVLIPDNDLGGVTSTLSTGATGKIVDLSVDLEIIHSWISDLRIFLITPDSTEILLHDREGADGDDINTRYDQNNVRELANLAGEKIDGDWSLKVVDKASADVGRLVRWGIAAHYEPDMKTVSVTESPNLAIPDARADGVSSRIKIQDSGRLQSVAIDVDIKHTYIGDLQLELVAPSGHMIRLHDRTGGPTNDLRRRFDRVSTPELANLLDTSIKGKWVLHVRDLASLDTGQLVSWTLTVEY